MQPMAVVRTYAAAFTLVASGIAYTSFTVPVAHTERPEQQTTLYAGVPDVLPGPPPQAQSVYDGEALAYLRIPRFGSEWLWVASEGITMDVLDAGPGHFPGTSLPGEAGNTSYAAHRSGHGDPFLNFEALQPGDVIVVAQNGAEWTYEVLWEPRVIEPDETWVVQQQTRWGREFLRPRLTLTTCWPKYGSEKRMYVRAALIEADQG